eukprot:4665045-Ditylum_brightwellii.AAC.1
MILIDSNIVVAIIGGTDHHPEAIGSVTVSWKDNDGKRNEYVLKNSLYFPGSLVNIISATSLDDQLNNNEGTYITTKRHYSSFVWDRIICNIAYQKFVANKTPTYNQVKKVDFEQELVEEYGAKIHNKKSEEQVDLIVDLQAFEWHNNASNFNAGDEAEYIAGEDLDIVKVTQQESNNEYIVQGKSGLPFNITKKKLKKVRVPDVGKVPSQADKLIQILKGLTKEQCEKIIKLDTLSQLQQEFLTLFDKAKILLCSSCVFGQSHQTPWQNKSKKHAICDVDDQAPDDGTSTDQMISGQLGL